MPYIENCTGVILCGGKSSRMGFDKSLLEINGTFVLLETVKKLEKIFEKVLLVTNKQEKFPVDFSAVEIKEDEYPQKGPLGGLVTALKNIETDYLFLLACDIPNINSNLISRMAGFIKNYDIVICKGNNQLEPLFAFYHISCLTAFQKQLETSNWRIRKEFNQFLVKEVIIDTSISLENVNLPEELVLWKH